MDKSKKEFGRELEQDIANAFEQYGFKARLTKGSGNKGSKGDVQVENLFVIEAKNRNTKDITVKADIWKKLKSEIPLHSPRVPLYVLRNTNQDTLVVLDLKDFLNILISNGEK